MYLAVTAMDQTFCIRAFDISDIVIGNIFYAASFLDYDRIFASAYEDPVHYITKLLIIMRLQQITCRIYVIAFNCILIRSSKKNYLPVIAS